MSIRCLNEEERDWENLGMEGIVMSRKSIGKIGIEEKKGEEKGEIGIIEEVEKMKVLEI